MMMKRRCLVLTALLVVLSLLPAATLPILADGDEGACLAWDITGVWQYRASAGGYGTLTFQQNLSNGWLTGSWHNEANGGRGDFDTGGIVGISIGFHPVTTQTWRGTVNAAGTYMAGTYETPTSSGTWEATGQARCLTRQPPPAPGSAEATVYWGDYVYRLELGLAAAQVHAQSLQSPDDLVGVQRINYPWEVVLIIEVIYYGDDLPDRVRVKNTYDGVVEWLGWLYEVEQIGESRKRYRGTVRIPQRQIGPGERIENRVEVISPRGREDLVMIVDQMIVDPSGYIYDADTMERIEGAMATCYRRVDSTWLVWDAEAWRQTNPLVSNEVGYYGWDVPQGDYKVVVTHDCYADAESEVVTVPPPRTDVHFALTRTGCSPLEVSDTWTADERGLPATLFEAGDTIQYHAPISNTGSSDITVELVWTVTDPLGRRVDALSGSDQYSIAEFGTKALIEKTVPADAAAGAYGLQIRLTHLQQTSARQTQFWVEAARAHQLYNPLVLSGEGTPVDPPGIHGTVTYNGSPSANTQLTLRHWDGSNWSTARTTRTGALGRYRFSGVATLGAGERYYVRFGPNSSNTDYLYAWYAHDITSYVQGTRAAGGDFDIANVDLASPEPNAHVTLPVTFRWQRRQIPGDSYYVNLFDVTGNDAWRSDDLGDVGSWTMGPLPVGASYDHDYGWTVWVCDGPDSCGTAYYYNRLRFTRSQVQAAEMGSAMSAWDAAERVGRRPEE